MCLGGEKSLIQIGVLLWRGKIIWCTTPLFPLFMSTLQGRIIYIYTNDLPLEIIYRLKVNCRKQLGFSCQLLANLAKNPIELTFGWNSLVYMICAILVHKINLCTQYLSLEINFSLYGWQIDNWWPTGTFLKSAR